MANVGVTEEIDGLLAGLDRGVKLDLLYFCHTWGVIGKVCEMVGEPVTVGGVGRALELIRERMPT